MMKHINFILKFSKYFVVLFFINSFCYAQNYQLVWFENFSGPQLDQSSWSYESGGNGWGNNELQFYTNRQDNLFIQDSKLIIKANKESYAGKNYTSARIITKGKKFFKYGKIEARIKLPFGKGIWPAFWLLGENFNQVGWPACGEIDIMEMVGGGIGDRTIYGTAHWSHNNSHASYGGQKSISSGIFADDFHIFGIEWTETYIKWFLDGDQYHVIDITPSGLSEFRDIFFVILNVAVGGDWPGSPDATTQFPQQMEVDYIRVFQDVPTSVKDESFELPSERLSVYPNPFNIETNLIISTKLRNNSLAKIKLFNLLGQEVYSDVITINADKYIYPLKLTSGINSGLYIVNVDLGDALLKNKLLFIK